MENLRDIKEIVEISSNSWIFLLIFCIFIFAFLLFFIKFYLKTDSNSAVFAKKQAFLRLKNLNFQNAKSCAYEFSENFTYFLNAENSSKFSQINEKLKKYKYKKIVPKLDENLKMQIKEIIGEISVKL